MVNRLRKPGRLNILSRSTNKQTMNRSLTILFLAALFTLNGFGRSVCAGLAIVNANVRTRGTPAQARSIAVLGNKIIAAGSDMEIRALIGPKTRAIDAKGRLVVPGFNDAHVHFLETGVQLASVDLRDAKTPEEFVERIKTFAAKQPKGRWILGGKWDHENWTPSSLPTAAMI